MSSAPAFPLDTPDPAALDHGLGDIVERRLGAVSPSPHPLIVHMLGLPGSGKSSAAREIHDLLQANRSDTVASLGFDALMEEIDAYRLSQDPAEAFARFELPARAAGYALLRGLMERRASILFDHGGAAPGHPDLLRHARALGYTLAVVQLACPPEVAAARIARRARAEGRHTPAHYIAERERVIAGLLPDYRGLADGFFVIDNGPETEPDLSARAQDVAMGILALQPEMRKSEPT